MTPERNPLDLNNLPEDYSRDGNNKHTVFEEGSSSTGGHRRKKNGGGGSEDECGKVYECRFCSLKFCKSQALGGHMNRHRQERETESLNKARQLVYSTDNLAAAHGIPPPHLGGHANIGGDPTLGFRSVYAQPRLFPAAQPHPPLPQINNHHPQAPFLYNNNAAAAASPSSTRTHLVAGFSSQYNRHPPINDFYVGHVLSTSSHHHIHNNIINNNSPSSNNNSTNPNPSYPPESGYTCIGAPVGGPGFPPPPGSVSMHGQEEVMAGNWNNGRGGGYGGMKQNL